MAFVSVVGLRLLASFALDLIAMASLIHSFLVGLVIGWVTPSTVTRTNHDPDGCFFGVGIDIIDLAFPGQVCYYKWADLPHFGSAECGILYIILPVLAHRGDFLLL